MQGVFTRDKRVTFVKGEVTTGTPGAGLVACGPGTENCLLVTLPQLAELTTRIKDSHFDSGLVHSVDYGSPGAVGEISFTNYAPDTDFFSQADEDTGGADEHSVIVQRAYADMLEVNLTEERRIWDEPKKTPGFSTISGCDFITGFTHRAELITTSSNISYTPAHYSPYFTLDGGVDIWSAAVELGFTGQVAIANPDADGDFSLFKPTNQLWVGMRFYSFGWDQNLVDVFADSFDDGFGNTLISGVELSLIMETGTVTCPLYGRGAYSHSGDGYNLRATEWWPYATSANPFGRVWEFETGVKIPAGAGFLDAGDPDEALAIHVFF